MSWGASPDDWLHFDLVLGLGEDLLPVVSNPAAKISAKSTIKAIGKTPSLYNRAGEVVGISNWTSKKASSAELDRWSRVADYGICLQTRRVRALDVDVTDAAKALEIERMVTMTLGFELPKRYRSDSAKRLFAFIVEGDIPKRVLPVGEGMIEFLGNGQQAVVSGTHTAGCRYEWAGGLPDSLPVLSVEVFEKLWTVLAQSFGTGDARIAQGHSAGVGEDIAVVDTMLPHLKVLGWSRDKRKAYIECPWKSDHTADSGESETVYFPAGTRGYEQGHFQCLHAHCVGRGDGDFVTALGIAALGFDVVTEDAGTGIGTGISAALPYILRTNDDGMTLATVENLHAVLTRPSLCGQYICYDTFRDEIVWKPVAVEGDDGGNCELNWQPFKDTDYTRLRAELALTGFLPIGRELIRDTVHRAAAENRIDTAQEWLGALPWDGVERVAGFLPDYMGAEPNGYNKAVGQYMWAAMAGRVMSPGCKADAAPIFVGEQYIGKSHAVASLVPDKRFFTEVKFDDNEDNLSRKMRGKLVAEFAELRGLHTKELEAIKAFISRQDEEWVPKYMEFSTLYPRRLLFIGTSNKDEIFADETGNRRWFPVEVKKADIAGIKNDRDQLWAEAREIFLRDGVHHYYDLANGLAQPIRENFMISDTWEDSISDWLVKSDEDGIVPGTCDFLQIGDIMWDVFSINPRDRKKFDEMRIAKILTKLGYKRTQRRVEGVKKYVWAKV